MSNHEIYNMNKTRVSDDPKAPFGYDDDGKPYTPYGLRKDGNPRMTSRIRTATGDSEPVYVDESKATGDPDQPWGVDDDGNVVAPYGFKLNGQPRMGPPMENELDEKTGKYRHVNAGTKRGKRAKTLPVVPPTEKLPERIQAETVGQHMAEYVEKMDYKNIIEMAIDRIASPNIPTREFTALFNGLMQYAYAKPATQVDVKGKVEHSHTHEHKAALDLFDDIIEEAKPQKNGMAQKQKDKEIIDAEFVVYDENEDDEKEK